MQVTAELSDGDLLARLKNFEDHFVERKSVGDSKDWLKTAVAFANSAPNGYPCVLYLGVRDSGEIETPQANLDKLQKSFNETMKRAFPPLPYFTKIISDDGKQALAAIVLGSELRPHFTGLAYVRKGSETREASEQEFDALIAQRNSKAARILQWKDKNITVFVGTGDSEIPWPNSTVLVDCDQFYVTIQAVPHEPPSSFPLSKVEINRDNLRSRLQLEISDHNRNEWDAQLERETRQLVGHTMTRDGQQLLQCFLKQGKIECARQFIQEISLNVQNEQMDIAVKNGIAYREQENVGLRETYYKVNSERVAGLKKVLPELLR